MTQTITAHTLDVPGARLHYKLRGDDGPLVVLYAAPMDARAYEGLADLLAVDHTVLTTDPRGILRSRVDDEHADIPPSVRADDIARLVAHLDRGPAVLLGSSGGAVTALAVIENHPQAVHTVIAHEPPLDSIVPDRDQLYADNEVMIERFLAGDVRGAWVQFMQTANIHMPEPVFDEYFGGDQDPQTLADWHVQFAHMLRGTCSFEPAIDVLRSSGVRLVVGIGEESTGELCDRTSRALADLLGTQPVMFPGGHTGFEEQPSEFAATLRAVLA